MSETPIAIVSVEISLTLLQLEVLLRTLDNYRPTSVQDARRSSRLHDALIRAIPSDLILDWDDFRAGPGFAGEDRKRSTKVTLSKQLAEAARSIVAYEIARKVPSSDGGQEAAYLGWAARILVKCDDLIAEQLGVDPEANEAK